MSGAERSPEQEGRFTGRKWSGKAYQIHGFAEDEDKVLVGDFVRGG